MENVVEAEGDNQPDVRQVSAPKNATWTPAQPQTPPFEGNPVIIRNPSLIRSCRSAGLCEFCKKPCKRREGAHIVSRGAGGSDLRCNLVRLGQTITRQCPCHRSQHDGGKPGRMDLLRISADREKCTTDDVLMAIDFFRRLDKLASKYKVEEGLLALPESARSIARRELGEAT